MPITCNQTCIVLWNLCYGMGTFGHSPVIHGSILQGGRLRWCFQVGKALDQLHLIKPARPCGRTGNLLPHGTELGVRAFCTERDSIQQWVCRTQGMFVRSRSFAILATPFVNTKGQVERHAAGAPCSGTLARICLAKSLKFCIEARTPKPYCTDQHGPANLVSSQGSAIILLMHATMAGPLQAGTFP